MLKRKLAFVLMVAIVFSVGCFVPAYADVAPDYEEAAIESQRASWQVSTSVVHTAANGYQVRFNIVLTVRNEASNITGGYITAVNSVTVSNVSGWYSVASQPVSYSIVSTTNNGQNVTINIKYSASIGLGYTTYDADVPVSLADI